VRRVLIVGSPGAGKSTLALALAARTRLPLTHLDAVYWQPGWVRPSDDSWTAKLETLLAAERWILDGNYTGSLARRAERGDTVVVLDFPRVLCLWRAIWRALRSRRPDRSPLEASGLHRDPLDREFLAFIWHFPAVARRQLALLSGRPGLEVVVLRSDAQVRRWLNEVGRPG